MAADPIFFRDLAYVLVAAVLGGALAWLARQPLILGYVLGGIMISPLTPGPSVSATHNFERFADTGVILLMFSIGIEFSFRDLLRVKWVAIVGGSLGMVLSIALGWGVGTLMGWSALQGIVMGMVLSVASTMVLARLLIDRGELHSRHGRIMVGITLVEDLAVIVLLVLLPRLGALESGRLLDIGAALGLAAAVLGPFTYVAAKVVPSLLTRVARMRNEELFFLVTLAIALGTGALTQAVGLSLALGAFLAGLIISQSDYAHETLARLLPMRDVFVALFFATIGVLINPEAVVANLPLLGVIVGLVMIGKFVIRTAVVRLFGHPIWTAVLVAVGFTQIGEFSFILIQVARDAGHVGDDVYNATLAASLLTILGNAFLVRYVPQWIGGARLAGQRDVPEGSPDAEPLAGHVVVCGFGRVGSAVAEAFETFETGYVAIETDPDIVKSLTVRGIRCLFGDASNRSLLEVAGASRAALVVVTLPDIERAHRAVRSARALNPAIPILARAHERAGRERLIEAGATEVIQPEFEAASTLIRHALQRLGLPRSRVLEYLGRYRGAMDPGRPAAAASDDPLPEVREVTVDVQGLADQSLKEARIRERFGVIVVTVARADGEIVFHPTADTVLRPGDLVRVFGLPGQIDAFLQELGRGAGLPDGSVDRR